MMQSLGNLLKEPLLHFLIVGALLFAAYDFVGGNDDEADATRKIVVNSDQLLEFLMLRSKAVAPGEIRRQMETFPSDELQMLVDNFVREEALYREAKALGLDEKDLGVRQRMVRQLEFINQGMVNAGIELTDEDLRSYYAEHQQRYLEPPTITFTHVFFSADRHGPELALSKAKATLKELCGKGQSEPVPFHRAPAYGDRFLYRQNYVNQELDEIRSHFGEEMQQAVFALEPDDSQWRGPYRSLYGYHLVMVTKKSDQRVPEFDEIRRRVEADAYQAKLDEQIRDLEKSVLEGYEVVLTEDLRNRLKVESTFEERP